MSRYTDNLNQKSFCKNDMDLFESNTSKII